MEYAEILKILCSLLITNYLFCNLLYVYRMCCDLEKLYFVLCLFIKSMHILTDLFLIFLYPSTIDLLRETIQYDALSLIMKFEGSLLISNRNYMGSGNWRFAYHRLWPIKVCLPGIGVFACYTISPLPFAFIGDARTLGLLKFNRVLQIVTTIGMKHGTILKILIVLQSQVAGIFSGVPYRSLTKPCLWSMWKNRVKTNEYEKKCISYWINPSMDFLNRWIIPIPRYFNVIICTKTRKRRTCDRV